MNQKLIVLLSVSVVVALFIIIPTDAYGVNTLKNVINFTGTYPAGVDEFDILFNGTIGNVSKAFSFMTFSHATDNNPSNSNRSWKLIDNSTGFTVTLYKTITINATEVDEDIALYGHSLDIIDTDLRDKALASGNDIIFTDNTGTTKIPHEIEFYNSTDGHLTAWVGVTNVSSTVDTTYRMWYSSPTATNTENPAGVWDSDYIAVWHLGDDDFTDSTGVHDGTNHGTTDTTGQIDGARFFPDDGSDIDVGGDESNFDGVDWTFSTWASRTDNTAVFPIVFTKMTTTEWEDGFGFIYQFDGVDTGTDVDGICTYAIEFDVDEVCFTPPSTFDLTHLVSTFNGTDLVLYSNGTEVDRTVTALSPVETDLSPRIGQVAWNENGDDWNGKIDELTASSIARSSDYITTKHCDQVGNSECPFDSAGSEQIGETFEMNVIDTAIIRIFGHSGTPANNDAVDFVGHVIEYTNDSDMFVQHESFTFGASTAEGEKFNKLPVAINSSSTMILGSGVDYDGVNLAYGSEEFGRWRIVNNTDWGYFVQDTPATGDNNVFAQIIDWNIPTVRVQTANVTMLNDVAKTLTVTPPIAVQPNRTMFIASYDTDEGLDVQVSRVMMLSFLQADGDMLFNKDDDRGTSVIDWQLVEFLDSDIFVIHNSTCTAFGTLDECDEVGAKLASGDATFNMPLPAVNVTESVGFSPLFSPFGYSMARTEGGDRGRTDQSMLTFELTSPTNLLMTRGDSGIDASVGFEVITWADMAGGGITFDQDVSDLVTVVDLSQNMNVTKVQTDTTSAGDTVNANGIFVVELTDQGDVLDVTSLNITKLNTDTVTALDETNFNISLGLIDTATILDLVDTNLFTSIQLLDTTNVNDDLQFAITKALTDLSTVLDDPDKDIDKTIADITTIIDQAEPEVIRQILELDTVTASDEVRLEIIKAIIDVITNSDDLNFSLDKILSDIAVVSDLIDSTPTFGVDEIDLVTANDLVILDVTKLLTDVASAIDDLDLQPTKVFIDTTIVTDTTQVDKESDVDESDSVTTTDDLIIDASKLILDLSTTQDQIVVLKLQEVAIIDTITVDDPSVILTVTQPSSNQTGGNTPISSGGGGGIPSLERLVGLSIQSELFFVGEAQTVSGLSSLEPTTTLAPNPVPSDFIIQTFGRQDTSVVIKNIQTDQQFTTWFQFTDFPQTLNFVTEVDRERAFSDPAKFENTALSSFVLTIPTERCDNQDPIINVPCIDPIVYEIPITFQITKGSVTFNERHIVTVDASKPLVCDPLCEFNTFLVENWWWLAGIVVVFMMLYFLGGKVVASAGGIRTIRRIDKKAFTSFEAKPKRKFKRGKR